MNMRALILLLLSTFFVTTALANENFLACKSLLQDYYTATDFSYNANRFPQILKDVSFHMTSKVTVDEVNYSAQNHFISNTPAIDNILVTFYNSLYEVVMKARFRPSHLLASDFDDGTSGYYFEGSAYELIIDDQVIELHDQRYLTNEFSEPTLDLIVYIDSQSQIKDLFRVSVEKRPNLLGQTIDMFTGNSRRISLFDMNFRRL